MVDNHHPPGHGKKLPYKLSPSWGPLFTSNSPVTDEQLEIRESALVARTLKTSPTADNPNTHATLSLGARGDACCASHGALRVPSGPNLTDSQRNTLRDICVLRRDHPRTVHRCPARSMDSGPHLPPLEGRRALHSCRLVFLSVSLIVGGGHTESKRFGRGLSSSLGQLPPLHQFLLHSQQRSGSASQRCGIFEFRIWHCLFKHRKGLQRCIRHPLYSLPTMESGEI
ncbi:hypothetical protein DFH08DRAFT_54724 [Mycena albidolilacea]|uniref:Uncharacterized protein n=1 Tax=Mycena albidolilacea TaxID=1033008 RepID=A0AAD7E9N4_9AGAR|nr:hypothetical protein DFH08DRAFT_54724 [Mycena albidolilacea]